MVKPPQRPVVSNRHQGWDVELYLLNKANIAPKMKHPIRLTRSVPQGNPWVQNCLKSVEMRYLKAPPMKLPIPTINSDFIMIRYLFGRIVSN